MIGIIGANGFVGTAMRNLFPKAECFGRKSSQDDINKMDTIIVCVPTPLKSDNSLDCSIVEDVVSKFTGDLIIIRSTMNPGTSDYLEKKYHKNICFVPEYVGETVNHPLINEKNTDFLIIGGRPENRLKAIGVFQTVYNSNRTIRQVTNYEAEVIKLCENRAIAFKVMQMHELYLACKKAGVDYYTIRDAVYGDDPRFNLWFTFVDEKKLGFNNSKCLSKDVPAWTKWVDDNGGKSDITKLLVKKSDEYE